MLLGIIGAMPEEINKVIEALTNKEVIERGSRQYYKGKLFGQDVVAVFSRWGKVASATTVTNLILEFNVDRIIFTGIAGGISANVHVGDIVIARHLFQHDMDARPLMRRFEIPLTGKTSFEVEDQECTMIVSAVNSFLENNNNTLCESLRHYGIECPTIHVGDIASGDLFISSTSMKDALIRNLPSVLCAEMEGAAVAQVCDDYGVPLVVVRIISDTADEEAHVSAVDFVNQHAGEYSLSILKEYIRILNS